MVTIHISVIFNILKRDEKQQTINQSLKTDFQYFITLIFFCKWILDKSNIIAWLDK